MIELTVSDHDEPFGLSLLRSAGGEWRLPRIHAPLGSTVRVRIRARDVMLALEKPSGISALNVLSGKVVEILPGQGPDAIVSLDCGGDRLVARITRRSVSALGLAPGQNVYAVVKAVAFDRGNVGGRASGAPAAEQ